MVRSVPLEMSTAEDSTFNAAFKAMNMSLSTIIPDFCFSVHAKGETHSKADLDKMENQLEAEVRADLILNAQYREQVVKRIEMASQERKSADLAFVNATKQLITEMGEMHEKSAKIQELITDRRLSQQVVNAERRVRELVHEIIGEYGKCELRLNRRNEYLIRTSLMHLSWTAWKSLWNRFGARLCLDVQMHEDIFQAEDDNQYSTENDMNDENGASKSTTNSKNKQGFRLISTAVCKINDQSEYDSVQSKLLAKLPQSRSATPSSAGNLTSDRDNSSRDNADNKLNKQQLQVMNIQRFMKRPERDKKGSFLASSNPQTSSFKTLLPLIATTMQDFKSFYSLLRAWTRDGFKNNTTNSNKSSSSSSSSSSNNNNPSGSPGKRSSTQGQNSDHDEWEASPFLTMKDIEWLHPASFQARIWDEVGQTLRHRVRLECGHEGNNSTTNPTNKILAQQVPQQASSTTTGNLNASIGDLENFIDRYMAQHGCTLMSDRLYFCAEERSLGNGNGGDVDASASRGYMSTFYDKIQTKYTQQDGSVNIKSKVQHMLSRPMEVMEYVRCHENVTFDKELNGHDSQIAEELNDCSEFYPDALRVRSLPLYRDNALETPSSDVLHFLAASTFNLSETQAFKEVLTGLNGSMEGERSPNVKLENLYCIARIDLVSDEGQYQTKRRSTPSAASLRNSFGGKKGKKSLDESMNSTEMETNSTDRNENNNNNGEEDDSEDDGNKKESETPAKDTSVKDGDVDFEEKVKKCKPFMTVLIPLPKICMVNLIGIEKEKDDFNYLGLKNKSIDSDKYSPFLQGKTCMALLPDHCRLRPFAAFDSMDTIATEKLNYKYVLFRSVYNEGKETTDNILGEQEVMYLVQLIDTDPRTAMTEVPPMPPSSPSPIKTKINQPKSFMDGPLSPGSDGDEYEDDFHSVNQSIESIDYTSIHDSDDIMLRNVLMARTPEYFASAISSMHRTETNKRKSMKRQESQKLMSSVSENDLGDLSITSSTRIDKSIAGDNKEEGKARKWDPFMLSTVCRWRSCLQEQNGVKSPKYLCEYHADMCNRLDEQAAAANEANGTTGGSSGKRGSKNVVVSESVKYLPKKTPIAVPSSVPEEKRDLFVIRSASTLLQELWDGKLKTTLKSFTKKVLQDMSLRKRLDSLISTEANAGALEKILQSNMPTRQQLAARPALPFVFSNRNSLHSDKDKDDTDKTMGSKGMDKSGKSTIKSKARKVKDKDSKIKDSQRDTGTGDDEQVKQKEVERKKMDPFAPQSFAERYLRPPPSPSWAIWKNEEALNRTLSSQKTCQAALEGILRTEEAISDELRALADIGSFPSSELAMIKREIKAFKTTYEETIAKAAKCEKAMFTQSDDGIRMNGNIVHMKYHEDYINMIGAEYKLAEKKLAILRSKRQDEHQLKAAQQRRLERKKALHDQQQRDPANFSHQSRF